MKKRYEHRLDKQGGCKRCGLSKWTSPHCPFGFWMTKLEAKTWDELPEVERGPYERWLMSQEDAPSPRQSEETDK